MIRRSGRLTSYSPLPPLVEPAAVEPPPDPVPPLFPAFDWSPSTWPAGGGPRVAGPPPQPMGARAAPLLHAARTATIATRTTRRRRPRGTDGMVMVRLPGAADPV